MVDIDAILDEANDIATDDEAVGAEAQEIAVEVFRQHLVSYLRAKKLYYEARNNFISALTINAMLQELNK